MGTVNAGLFASTTDEWHTPQDLFDTLDNEFGFTVDVCASPENTKCASYYTREDDGLEQDWRGAVWMNPPYGRELGLWVRKAYLSTLDGVTAVCLIPARTDTAYWHDYVMRAAEIRLIRGRLSFGGPYDGIAHNAPFPSAVVVFRPGDHRPTVSSIGRNGGTS
uniref:DNA N-6-adenine-methyltransferase (Dam) n=1 Tax=uncultured organism TaxID=155900 RepID=A0A7L9QC50_9ZZZZ|nr:hypothetical protein [uncultured organism]